MLNTARVALPPPVEARLRTASEFVENITEFARDDLVGFRRPLAAAFALSTPPAVAFVYQTSGLVPTLQWAMIWCLFAALGLAIVGRQIWPELVEEFEHCATAKRKAEADLRCGYGEAAYIGLSRGPYFVEHDHGVLVLADAGDFRTLFFSVTKGEEDPRWAYYESGEMERRVWRWLRLPVSRDVVRFASEGSRVKSPWETRRIESVDVWEAIHVALGEPLDGGLVHRPLDELVETIERMM